MICREEMETPNRDDRYSVTGGHDNPNPNWCDCRQVECAERPPLPDPDEYLDTLGWGE